MIARILPPSEWGRLAGTDTAPLLKYIPEQDIAMIVVEDDSGRIVARWCVFQATHFEGLWIDPEFRGNAGVVRPLLRQAFAVPQIRGERWAFSGAAMTDAGLDTKVDQLLQRLGGQPMPIKFYAIPVASQVEH